MDHLTAIKDGDPKIFKIVFDQYHEKIYGYILSKSRSEYLAEEVVQLTFIKLWNYRETLNPLFTLQTQIFRIASTTLIDLLRKQNNYFLLMRELDQQPVASDDRLLNNIHTKELQIRLADIMKGMPRVRRKVFEMSRFEGMDYKEIATTLSISIRTVETHIFRAVKQLRRHMPLFINVSWLIIVMM